MTRRVTVPRAAIEPLTIRTQNEVAEILGITRMAVGWAEQNAFRKIMAAFPGLKIVKKNRRCLRCGEEFESTGPGNRICNGCEYGENRRERKRQNNRNKAARKRAENPRPEYTASAD